MRRNSKAPRGTLIFCCCVLAVPTVYCILNGWPERLDLNAFAPLSRRIPEGPSSQQPIGRPVLRRLSLIPPNAAAVPGVTFELPIPSPRTMQARSSSLSCAM